MFSIVVPTHSRPTQLAACLQAIAGLEYPRESFEVLVVDDGSPAPPEEVVRAAAGRMNVKLLSQPHLGPAAARNNGAQIAKGQLLAFTDDDCAPSTGWLKALDRRLEQAPGSAVGGHTINALVNNPYSAASQMLIDYLYSYFNADQAAATFLTSNNLCVPAEQFRALGGFDPSFPLAAGEDRDFCDRWLASGKRLFYEPRAVVYHKHSLTLWGFLHQHFNYGRGSSYYHQLRGVRGGRKGREPLSFYVNLLRHPLSSLRNRGALSAGALLAASQVANAAGSLWEEMVGR